MAIDETTAQSTDRFGISYPGRYQQNSYTTLQSGFTTIDSLIFSVLESNNLIIKTRPNVSVELDGSDYKFKQDGDAEFISRTYQSTITVQQEDLVVQKQSLIGVTIQSGATTAQTVEWTLYQSNIPVDNSVVALGIVNDDYSITWYNGSHLAFNTEAPLFSESDFYLSTKSGTEITSATHTIVDNDTTLYVSATATMSVTITIPSDQVLAGRKFRIIDTGNNCSFNNITVQTEGSVEIQFEEDLLMTIDGMTVDLDCDGSNFFVV